MATTLTIALAAAPGHQLAADALRNDLLIHGHIVSHITPHTASSSPKDILLGEDQELFSQLTLLVGMADLLVLLLPADQNAACLAGMADISGVPVAAVESGTEQEHSFMLRGCVNFWCEDTSRLLEVIAEWPDLNEDSERDLWRAVREGE